MTAGSARARYATTKTAANSAARAVGAARPTRVRSTPSQAGPNPTPVTAVAAKNRSGEVSAIAATATTRPAPRMTPPTIIARAVAHERVSTIATAPISARRKIASPPSTRLDEAASCEARLGPRER